MLAVAQGLVRRPRLLMLDEPSAGLSPVLVDRVFDVVRALRETGTAVLLVEQLIEKALALADRVYALARGSIVLEAGPARPICRTGWSTPISARTSTAAEFVAADRLQLFNFILPRKSRLPSGTPFDRRMS